MKNTLDVNTLVGKLNELQKQGLGLKKIATDIEISFKHKENRTVGEIKTITYDKENEIVWLEGK